MRRRPLFYTLLRSCLCNLLACCKPFCLLSIGVLLANHVFVRYRLALGRGDSDFLFATQTRAVPPLDPTGLLLPAHGVDIPSCTTAGCHAGFCDPSIGHCICLPGWRGPQCDDAFLGACRMNLSHGLEAPCDGFAGVMSCQCRRDCAVLHSVHGPSKTLFNAADLAPCWTASGHEELSTSGLPAEQEGKASVEFWALRRSHYRKGWIQSRFIALAHLRPTAGDVNYSIHEHNGSSKIPLWGGSRLARDNRMVYLEPDGSRQFLPNSRCPLSCSHRGSCVAERLPTNSWSLPHCKCHGGHRGHGCELPDNDACMHSCSSHGTCSSRMCLCDLGWWGLDCSLSRQAATALSSDHLPADGSGRSTSTKGRYAPTYVLPIPTTWSMHFIYQGMQSPRRGMYEASRLFLEKLHDRREIVARPEEATLFYVPVLFTQMHGCLW